MASIIGFPAGERLVSSLYADSQPSLSSSLSLLPLSLFNPRFLFFQARSFGKIGQSSDIEKLEMKKNGNVEKRETAKKIEILFKYIFRENVDNFRLQ